jgi:LPXTG-motif cell wall-anchored protein
MQAQGKPVDFVAEPHTDFIFAVEGPMWPIALAAIGAALLVLGFVVRRSRRRRRDEP